MKRRDFLSSGMVAGIAAGAVPSAFAMENSKSEISREKLRLGFIGVGGRGRGLLRNALRLSGVQIYSICDIAEENLQNAQNLVKEAGQPVPKGYGKDKDSYKEMLEKEDLDGVVIGAPWKWQVPMAIAAMKAGVYAAHEVGPASSVDECWELVKTYEETGIPGMMLENYCYHKENMMVLNMIRQGLFGELIHCKCGYGHELRERLVLGKGTGPNPMSDSTKPVKGEGDYRSVHNQFRNGDLYPTHGVGPIAQFLDIQRGNRFLYLTSTATKARGLSKWSEENLPADHPRRNIRWRQGDIVTTTISCYNGESIIMTFDTRLPRPRTDMYLVQGTNGIWENDQKSVYIEGRSPKKNKWEPLKNYVQEFEHPLWRNYLSSGESSKSGHGGTDYLELRAFAESIRQGTNTPIDVYDTAAWRSIGPLSEASIAMGSHPVEFPDFTNGKWMTNKRIFGLTEKY